MNRRVVGSVLACMLCGVIVGCGDGGSDADQITSTMRHFAQDAKDKDWDAVCDALSSKAKRQITVAGALLGESNCESVVAAAAALDDDSEFGKVGGDKVKVTNIKVSGDKATADVSPSSDEDPTTRLVREDGKWKVDSDPDDESDEESSSATSTTADEDDQTEVAAPSLRVPERGFSRVGEDSVSYGIVVRNPDARDAVEVEVQVNLLGSDGGVIATETDSIRGIPAGEEANIGGESNTDGEKVSRLEITVTAESGADPGTVQLPEISRVKLSRDDFGLTVRAQLENTLDEPISQISDVFAVLRNRAGRIVGGLSGFPEAEVAPGRRAAVRVGGLTDFPSATHADVTADAETS